MDSNARNNQAAVLTELESTPSQFPRIAVRVGEIPGIAASEGVLRRFPDLCPRRFRLLKKTVHIVPLTDVVSERDSAERWPHNARLQPYVFRQITEWVQCQADARRLEGDHALVRSPSG